MELFIFQYKKRKWLFKNIIHIFLCVLCVLSLSFNVPFFSCSLENGISRAVCFMWNKCDCELPCNLLYSSQNTTFGDETTRKRKQLDLRKNRTFTLQFLDLLDMIWLKWDFYSVYFSLAGIFWTGTRSPNQTHVSSVFTLILQFNGSLGSEYYKECNSLKTLFFL